VSGLALLFFDLRMHPIGSVPLTVRLVTTLQYPANDQLMVLLGNLESICQVYYRGGTLGMSDSDDPHVIRRDGENFDP